MQAKGRSMRPGISAGGDGTDEITSWVAICGDGKAVALAAYYAVPGRIEKVVDFMPAVDVRVVGEHAS
jgi:hypothetical protein